MANVFEKPEKFAATGLALLQRTLGVANLFRNRYGRADFSGAKGDVVNIKRPPILRARDAGFRTRNTPLVVDSIVQSKIQVALTRHPYSRIELTPEEATLDEVSYVADVQAPQVRAIAEDFEETIAGALAGADFVHEVNFIVGDTGASGDARKVARRAKRLLDESKVPAGGRYWLVGSAVSEAVANTKELLDVDTSGLPEALRDGVVGRLSGFVIVDWPVLDVDESYFVHESALAVAAVAPVVPRGAAAGASIAAEGLAVTQVWDYQSDSLADQSTVHAFTGAGLITDPQLDSDGRIVLDNDEPVLEFVRAVKVVFAGEGEGAASQWTLAVSDATGGTYTLTANGKTTAPIAHGANAGAVESALNLLDGVTAVVSGTTTKTVTFTSPQVVTADGSELVGEGAAVTVAAV